ncbi:MAG: hypothetical protein Q7O66_06380, partial [Dehalococcoidia bacterium]|nr:hypothetical protein [Dehalococcoidia bacterium]
WDKMPPTEYYLEACIAHHDIMTEYGFYDKLNKLMHCPLDCSPNGNFGELGMLALAGDIGKWAAQVFPEEGNWLGKFVTSLQSTAKTN